MSKQTKPNHNPRNPNICRNCNINTIGKTRLAYGHTVCQACSKRLIEQCEQAAQGKSEIIKKLDKLLAEQGKENKYD